METSDSWTPPTLAVFDHIPGDVGQCMGDDAVEFPANVSGIGDDPFGFNCTANDVSIARARAAGDDPENPTPIPCVKGEEINQLIVADIVQGSKSARTDIGIWVANEGGTSAESGACVYWYLEPGTDPAITIQDGDQCGDLFDKAVVTAFELDNLTLICEDDDGDGFLEIPACVSWTQPGGDRVCPDDAAGDGDPPLIDDFRAATLPATKSKCNCDPFFVPIEIQAELTLIKTVTNDDGGTASATDWTLTATGDQDPPTVLTGTTPVNSPAEGIPAGTYALAESGGPASGYTTGNWSCVINDGDPVIGSSVTLLPGDAAVCTINNDDIRPQLTVIKHVINDDGGSAVASDFTMQVTATNPDQASFPGAESPGTTIGVNAGAYSVDEIELDGYTKTIGADCSGTIAVGESKTCTITNDDDPAGLIVIKQVINDDGGTKVASDFTINVTATNPDPASFPGAESPGTAVAVEPGAYSVDEVELPGYAKTLSADCSGTIALGETKTCTITNDDIRPQLTVIKHVINDDGGSAVASDFTMQVTATNPDQASFPGAESPGTTIGLDAGAYSVDEIELDGYTKTIGADCSGTIALAESKTCTITNDDDPAHLRLVKVVINDDAGAAAAGDWELTASGPTGFSGFGDVEQDVAAGTYTLSESGPLGYTASNWSCVGDGTQNGDQITLGLGESATCTITNDDVETCELGDRITSVTLEVLAASPDPILVAWTDDNGNLARADILGSAVVGTGDEFGPIVPDGQFFDSQNLRFFFGDPADGLEGVEASNMKVHLSCSDDPFIGQQHSGTANDFSMTVAKTAFITEQFN